MDHIKEPQANVPGNGTADDPALLKSIAMGGPALVAVVEAPELKIRFINTQFERSMGYSQGEIDEAGMCFTDLMDEYMIDRLQYQLNNVKGDVEAESRFVIYHLKNKNGQSAPYHLYAAPILYGDGAACYQLALHPDLSCWDIPFSSFYTRELFLEHFKSDSFGTFEWLVGVDKVFWSIGVYRIYEVDDLRQQITNRYAASFTHPDDKARVSAQMKLALETGDDVVAEFKILTAKDNIKVVHTILRAVRNRGGRLVKFAGSIRDITEQRRIEEDLKNKVEELHHSNKELEEFAYVASHDMQEPLRKITTFSDRLSEKYKDALTGDGQMYLSRMIASAENMRALINNLLEFSRVSKADQPFEKVSLEIVLRQVKTDLELVIEETGTVINSRPLPKIDAVSSQMKQLFANLIGNSIKFRKPDVSPVINIEAAAADASDIQQHELDKGVAYCKIQITDNGIGFESEYAQRIFQVFQRLHGKSEYPGSGIGLAICKKILEYHRGVIFAENIDGAGARFTFILPAVQAIKKKDYEPGQE